MFIRTVSVGAITAGKATSLLDFEQLGPDITAVRITNLSTEHAAELFTAEAATATQNCVTLAAGGTHYLEVPNDGGGQLYGASATAATEVKLALVGVKSALPALAVG